MKIVFLLIVAFLMNATANAGDPGSGYGTLIAVELKLNDKSTGSIGKLEYTDKTIDMVTFTPGIAGSIVALPEVCKITEKKINSKGVHHIKCSNQYGTTVSGTIDFRDEVKPKITLIRENGTVITNISAEGKKWQKKNIPNVPLGQ
jgi:hypothetical protein